MDPQFKLEITSQYWFGPYEDPQADSCSHGSIRAEIGGVVVTSDEASYGISQSALALPRTLEQDHTPACRVTDDFLLCHGCGYPLCFGFGNFGTNCVVRHIGNQVVLTVERSETSRWNHLNSDSTRWPSFPPTTIVVRSSSC